MAQDMIRQSFIYPKGHCCAAVGVQSRKSANINMKYQYDAKYTQCYKYEQVNSEDQGQESQSQFVVLLL